jgi:two-component system response regulator FixJ
MTSQTAPVISIVDDDPAVRDSLCVMLRAYGMNARDYESARKFLADLRPNEPGCLILDLDMPEMSGVEVIEVLRDDGVHLPVIVFTGRSDAKLRDDLPVVAVLVKPLDTDRLLEAVKRAISIA